MLAKTVSGQVREVELRLFARFKLVDKDGRVWIEETEMFQKREMSYSESLALMLWTGSSGVKNCNSG